LHAFYLKKWFVPEKISLISCDDEIPLERNALPMTAVDLNRATLGEKATRMLLEKIAQPEKRLPSQSVEGTLIERMSVAAV
jgi:DNA-binding LacI/PurR family transcriptional regulator